MSTEIKKRKSLPERIGDFFDNNQLFTPIIHDLEEGLLDFGLNARVPSVNIIENTTDFKIEMAAPGLDKKDFMISVDNGLLTVKAEKEEKKDEVKENYRRKEFSYNFFKRSFSLPQNSAPDKLDAKYENGILRLTLPKKEVTPVQPKREITVS
jgi:HSP20 family protein